MNNTSSPPTRSHFGYDLAVLLTLLLLLLLLFVLPRENCCGANDAAASPASEPALTATGSAATPAEQAPTNMAMPASDAMPASGNTAMLVDQEAAWPGCEAVLTASYIGFESGSGRLTEKGARLLDRLLDCLGDGNYLIVGHTDSQGDAASNETLSRLRAEAVKAYLIDKGIRPGRLATRGVGETDPIASNDTEAGRARNRRIEFIKLP